MSATPLDTVAWANARLPSLDGRRALVTGAASGLGYETALGLAARGAEVILADRNVEGGRAALGRIREQLPQALVEFRQIDLAELAQIRAFARALEGERRALDVLVANAGILPPLQRRTTVDGFELKFGINVLGHFALVGGLLGSLQRSTSPRVVWVSSLVHRQAQIDFDDLNAETRYAPQRAYNQAKLACLMLALETQARAQAAGSRLQVLAAHPGVAKTALGDSRNGQPRRGVVDHLTDVAFNIAMRFFSQPQGEGARPILHAAAATDARGGEFYGPDGFGEMRGAPTRVTASKLALDAGARARLWTECEAMTGAVYGWRRDG